MTGDRLDEAWQLYRCADCDPEFDDESEHTSAYVLMVPEGEVVPDDCPRCGSHLGLTDGASDLRITNTPAERWAATRKPHVHVPQEDLGGYVGEHNAATLTQVAEAHNISEATARRKLDGLVVQGLLHVMEGERGTVGTRIYLVPGQAGEQVADQLRSSEEEANRRG